MKNLTDQNLLEKIKLLVKAEREATYEVLLHLREVERRMLFAKLGYSSLFVYAVQELKYSEDESARRISAMRLLREIPEIETPLKNGSLSLSNLGQARTFFKAQGIKNTHEKKAILQKLENKSKREGENILASLAPEQAVPSFTTIELFPDLKKKLEMVRKNLGLGPELSYEELLHKMADHIFTNTNPPAPARVNKAPHSTITRYIPQKIKTEVYHREQGRCAYVSSLNKKRCNETKHLQYEHIKPYALGGESSAENLTLLCQAHNKLNAVEIYGSQRMQKFLPNLRE